MITGLAQIAGNSRLENYYAMKKNGFVFLAFPWKPSITPTAATTPVNLIWLMGLTLFLCAGNTSYTANTALGFQASPQQTVDGLNAKFNSLNQKLTTIEAEINTGEGDLSAKQSQYRDVLDELNQTIDELKESCLNAIEADPGNQKNIQTVMGILLNDADKEDDRAVLRACDRLIAAGIHPAYFEYAAKAGRIKIGAREIFDEALIRLREAKTDDLPRVLMKTSKGDITFELYENEAPNTVANFITLVENGFYNDCLFHSVIESFRAQTGGPTRTDASRKDPGYTIACECYQPDARPHFTDVLSMAVKSTRDTGGSQFIITLDRTTELDGKHTVFGRIIDGHEVTDQLVRTAIEINGEATDIPNANPDYIISAEVIRKRDHEYQVRKVGDPEEEKKVPVAPPAEPETKPFDDDAGDAPAMEAADDGSETSDDEAKEANDKESAAKESADKESADNETATKETDSEQSETEQSRVQKPASDEPEAGNGSDVEAADEKAADEKTSVDQ